MKALLPMALLLAVACAHADAERAAPSGPVCQPPAGMGAICFYRNQAQGSALDVDLVVDDKHVAQIENDHFVQIDVAPGAHRVAAGIRIGNPSVVDTEVAAGATTFMKITMDFVAEGVVLPTVRPTGPARAKQEIHEDCEPGFHGSVGAPGTAQPVPAQTGVSI